MTRDSFWKSVWLSSLGMLLLCIAVSASLFFTHISGINAASLGIDYTPDKDPFENGVRQTAYSVSSGYVYKDSFPLGISTWAWSANSSELSKEQVYEGANALKLSFNKSWAGFGLSGLSVDTKTERSISLAVYPDANVGDMFIELYDKKGRALGRQSLGWYAPQGALVPNTWQVVTIPIQNLLGSESATTITALAVSTTNEGVAYVDSMQFLSASSSHEPWVYKAPESSPETPQAEAYVPPPFNPFATSTAVSLPYALTRSSTWDDNWFAFRGHFSQDYDAWRVGPAPGQNDALVAFRGGLSWTDYQINTTVSWGGAAVLALVARMEDENNYVECSYTGQGDFIQMYVVKNGVSTMVMESEKQHYYGYKGGAGQLGLVVQGHTLACVLEGQRVISKDLPDMASAGTIGFEAWDQNDKTGPHLIESLTIKRVVGE